MLGSVYICSLLTCGCLGQFEPAAPDFPSALASLEPQTAANQIDAPEADSPAAEPPPQQEPPDRRDAQDPDIYSKLRLQVADPLEARQFVLDKLTELEGTADKKLDAEKKYYQDGLFYLNKIDRATKVELTLPDAIRRALESSYNIRVQSYNPAIGATNVVEAEAAFDMIFFSDATFAKNNTPTSTTLTASDSTTRIFSSGLRKFLPTGANVEVAWTITRSEFDSTFAFSTLNPSFRNELNFLVRQPFLRGFGLDFNRSRINLASNDRHVSTWQFERTVQDHLLQVEEAYWRLAGARRTLVIEGRLITEFQKIYDYLFARRDFDVTPVELNQSKARLDIQIAGFSRVKQNVRDAEDNLKALLNDPALTLADDLEIIPTEFPTAEGIVLDRLAELQAALDHRQELHEAELAIESARINVGVAKNQALPRFDVTFRYAFDALGKSQHDAFQNLSAFDFHNYSVGLQFEWPIGNRGARAAVRRARQQHAQALASLKLQIEGILRDVNQAIRELNTSFEQIGANLTSVESALEDVRATEERAERRDPNQLNLELSAQQRLSSARQSLLQSLLNYNFSISRLERAKGTLLEFNNITVADTSDNP